MYKFRQAMYCSAALLIAAGSPSALADTNEDFRPKVKKPSISRSGQIGESRTFRQRKRYRSGGFLFFGRSFDNYRTPQRDHRFNELPRRQRSRPNPIYTYVPDTLHRLSDRKAKQPRADHPVFGTAAPAGYDPTPVSLRTTKLSDSLAQTIFDLIKSGTTDAKVTKAQRKAITEFYRDRGYKALWTSMDGVEQRAYEVLELLGNAEAEGLDPADYRLPVVRSNGNLIGAIETDLTAIAQFDIQLTAMAVRYAQHATGGRITANRLSGYHDLKQPVVAAKTALKKLAKDDQPARYLSSLHPRHDAYVQLKAALAEERINGQKIEVVTPIPDGPMIRPGGYDERIPEIRSRLIKDGHLEANSFSVIPTTGSELPTASPAVIRSDDGTPDPENSSVYDSEMVEAVRSFQRASGLSPDGIIGRRTIRALNGKVEETFDKVARIVANMERLRWLPRNLGRSHIFVNQAAYRLNVMRNGRSVWKTKVIVGKPSNQTSFFSDEMETVVFNPYWGVPQSIITNEMLPKLVNDPSYLDREGYEVYNNGRRVRSSHIDWWNRYDMTPFAVRQPPGRRNALGELKFLFPNKHAIYLHDTPTKKLFNRDERAFSHGCVRVQNPRELAEAVLGWDQNRIASQISTGRNRKFPLERKLPVHLTYFTAWPNAAGTVEYHKDIYGRDARLELAFAATSASYR